ncbi:hypothetical protein NDU88_003379 [Pleurodeles waltl]|uniref:Uncharacterized protein n=1 Tax=Pleurodeles waltl TaxID=8319 RepID=A0AAV7SF78_PLEWA|nr:hypothetical protein NDU88_003379 [Pleurodeles waltl]
MVKTKGPEGPQTNKMDNYTVPRVQADGGDKAIMAAIQDVKGTLEPKLNAATVDAALLRVDLKMASKKVTTDELHVNLLQSTTKRLESQVQLLTQQTNTMAAKLDDQKDRARRNNIWVVGVPEGTEG